MNRIWWSREYEIHFCADAKTGDVVEGPIAVYFPLRRETWYSRFIPRPSLTERTSPLYDPAARPLSGHSDRSRFVVTPEGIVCSNPYITGLCDLVERMRKTGGLQHVFTPGDPPPLRWENVQLIRGELPESLDEYCFALRKQFANGFVECRRYAIAAGALEDDVMREKRRWFIPHTFMEILRHPWITADFEIQEANEQVLSAGENWTCYSPFLFAGYLAETLAYGGAYSPLPRDVSVPLRLADAVFADLNRDYRNFELHVCRKPWSPKFGNIAWDHSWIIFDWERREITLLLGTDTD